MASTSTGPPGRTFDDVVAAVVEPLAPDEMPVLARLRRVDHDEAVRGLRRRAGGDGLGFGWPDLLPLLTPGLYIALDQALRKVVDLTVEGGLRGLLRRRRGRRASSPTLRPLSENERAQVCEDVRLRLERDGVPPERAREIADRLEQVLDDDDQTGETGDTD